MDIPQGYKHTELGIIPQEWEILSLSALGEIYSGGTPDTTNPKFWDGEILWCTPSDITSLSSNYISDTEGKITEEGLKKSSAIILPAGSLIVCTRATIGNIAIATKPLSTNQGFKNIVPSNDISVEWLFYNLLSAKNRLVKLGCGSTFLEVSKKDFERFRVTVPPVEEQRKIAEILGVWDKAIELQVRIIDKLELRKRALMQCLLSGRHRLPGFSYPWQKVRLGDLFDERVETKCAQLPLLSITADRGVILQTASDKKDTSNEDKSKYKRICPNDIGYNTMRMWQGRSALSKIEGIVSPAYTIVTPKTNVNPAFMIALLQQSRTVYDFWTHSQGLVDDTLNCKYHHFSQVKVCIPSLAEQTAIAEVLSTADKEIEIAKAQLAAYRTQKRGLMQQLLTGKKRVKHY